MKQQSYIFGVEKLIVEHVKDPIGDRVSIIMQNDDGYNQGFISFLGRDVKIVIHEPEDKTHEDKTHESEEAATTD